MKKWNWTRLYKTKEAQIRAYNRHKKDKAIESEAGSAIHKEIQELIEKAIQEEL
tara:strand:- start:830 stop:991 length:162 start_codon:yes stop_codon:yes gene_type:complete